MFSCFLARCFWSRCFLGWSFLTLLTFWRRCYILTCSFLGRNLLGWCLLIHNWHLFFFCWNIGSGNSCSCPLSSKCFLGRSFQESCLFKFPSFKLDESCLCDFLTIEICHLGFLFSGFNLLDPPCGCLLCRDICLLSGFSNILLVGTVWELEVSELYAFERHSLSPYLSIRSIHQSPVLITNIYDHNQLPSTRLKGGVGHPANLYEVPEHHVGGIWQEGTTSF